jgi:hypothetical protein
MYYRIFSLDRRNDLDQALTPRCTSVAAAIAMQSTRHAHLRRALIEQERLPGHWTDSAGESHERWSHARVVEVYEAIEAAPAVLVIS